MTESIDIVVPAVGGADAAAASVREIGTAADETATKMAGLGAAAKSAGDGLGGGAEGAKNFAGGAEHAKEGAAQLEEGLNSLKETLLALGLALGFKEWVELTDTFTTMQGRLEQVTASGKELQETYKELLGVANEIHAPLQQVSELYVAMTKNSDALGTSSKDNMTVITTIGNAMRAAGKDTTEMGGVTEALSRAFETGSFQGRSWITILRGAPELAIALAESFNMTTKQLGAALQAGTVSMSSFVEHVISLNDDFAKSSSKMEVTVGQAWQNMKNAVMDYFGTSDRATGLSNLLAQAILFISRNASIAMPIITALGAAVTAMAIAAGGAALAWVAMLSPVILISGAVAAAGVLILAFGNDVKLTADGSITLLGALRGVFSLLWQTIQGGIQIAVATYNALQNLSGGFSLARAGVVALSVAVAGFIALRFEAAIETTIAAFAPFVPAMVLVVAGILSVVAAIDVAKIGMALWAGDSMDQAIAKAKSFNDSLLTTASSMKTQFINALTEGTTATKGLGGAAETAKHALDLFTNSAHGAAGGADKLANSANNAGGAMKSLGDSAASSANKAEEEWRKARIEMAKAADAAHTAAIAGYFGGGGGGGGGGGRGGGGGGGGGGSGGGSTDIWGGTNPLDQGQAGTVELGGRGDYLQTLHQLQMDGFYDVPTLINNANHGDAGSLAKLHTEYNAANEIDKALMKNLFAGGYAGFGGNGAANGGGAPLNAMAGFASGGAFTVGGNGGTDSQLVQFMATPGEDVSVRTPAQQQQSTTVPGGGARPVHVHMTVVTPDAASFGRSQRQIAMAMQGRLSDVSRYIK